MTEPVSSLGRSGFAERLGVDTPERRAAVELVVAQIKESGLQVIRLCFVDTHGIVRVRPVEARHFAAVCRNGIPFSVVFGAMDSANMITQDVFSRGGGFGRDEMSGAGDMLGLPDLATFHILPWARNTGWILCDMYLTTGERWPFDPRAVMQKACGALAAQGFDYIGGVEVEFHVFKVDDAGLKLEDCTQPGTPPKVSVLRHAYQYMSELVVDDLEQVILPLRETLLELGLPLRTLEAEWGPGQLEVTFDPLPNVAAADAVVLMRQAVKQVCKRMGLIASFMTKPGLPNVFSAGWHLHQSLAHAGEGGNAFAAPDALLSPVGLHFIGGLLHHARSGSAFSNPTINGYKRLNANPLAPKRAVWSNDNKAAMCRLIGGPGDPATHIENRSGEPLANPYLYMGSQIFAGLDGMAHARDPGPPLHDPYAQAGAALLPTNLAEAIGALTSCEMSRAALGDEFVNHYVNLRRFEIARFEAFVTDWEHREYFEAY
jgi:glutamine synthetase